MKTQAVPPLWQFSGLMFRAKLVWKRLQRSWSSLVLMAAAIFLIYRAGIFVQHTFSQNLFTLLTAAFSGRNQDKGPRRANQFPTALLPPSSTK